MERENRYIVIKIKDVHKYLDHEEFLTFGSTICKIDYLRKQDEKPPLQCVVVESDWPEYEVVWKMIEDRCKNE